MQGGEAVADTALTRQYLSQQSCMTRSSHQICIIIRGWILVTFAETTDTERITSRHFF